MATTEQPESTEKLKSWCVSEIPQEEFEFVWKLVNVPDLLRKDSEIISPVFKGGPLSNHEWVMKIQKKDGEDGINYTSLYVTLKKIGGNQKEIILRMNLRVTNNDGTCVARGNFGDSTVFKLGGSWGFSKWIKTETVLQNTDLTIGATFSIPGKLHHKEGTSRRRHDVEESSGRRRLKTLSKHMLSMLNQKEFSDLSILTNKNQYHVHKVVMAGRSPVFHAMLRSSMTEALQSVIKIQDFDDEVVKAMLEFIYTGKTGLMERRAPEILQIADKYELLELKYDCERVMRANLSIHNASDFLILARLHNATTLKEAASSFMRGHKNAVRLTDSFTRLTKAPDAASIFMELYLEPQIKEEEEEEDEASLVTRYRAIRAKRRRLNNRVEENNEQQEQASSESEDE